MTTSARLLSVASASPPHEFLQAEVGTQARRLFGPKFRDFERLFPIFVREGRSRKRYKAGYVNHLGETVIPPTFEEAYLAHQQGIGGASCLLGNPNAAATSCVAADAVTGNGGNTGMSSGEFSALVEGYYNTGSLTGARTAAAP